MELTLTPDLAKELFDKARNPEKVARTLAAQYLANVEPVAMASYLLQREVAERLLAERLQGNPGRTVSDLQQLPQRSGGAENPAPVEPRAARAPSGSRRSPRGRRRLTPKHVEELKQQVKSFLAAHPWATRKQLTARVRLSTQSIYRRVMTELQEANEIVSRGSRATTEYAIGAGGRKSASNKKTAAKKSATKKSATKKSATKKLGRKKAVRRKSAKKASRPAAAKKSGRKSEKKSSKKSGKAVSRGGSRTAAKPQTEGAPPKPPAAGPGFGLSAK